MSEIQLLKKDLQNRLNSIRIKPDNLDTRNYDVSIKYYSRENLEPEKRVDYKVTSELKVTSGIGEIIINKENVFYNQHQPDLINEIISNTITKSVYPIKTNYNEKGFSSNEILNLEEIKERWKAEKQNILEKYNSEDLDNFIGKFEQKLNHKSQLEKSLHYDWFWNLFFHPKLINYGDKRTVNKNLFLSIVPYSPPFRFKGTQKIEKIPTKYHSFKIDFISNQQKAPKFFHPKNLTPNAEIYMDLNVQFDLDLYHHFPMHTIAELEIYTKDNFDNKTQLKKIIFTMYQVNSDEYNNKKLSPDSPFITGGLVKLPPNKWGFDNFENLENDW